MGKNKVISQKQAAALVKDGDLVTAQSIGMAGYPMHLIKGVQKRFREQSHPRDITFMWSCGLGNWTDGQGADPLVGEDGLVKRIITGYVGASPAAVKRVNDNSVEAYLMPQGAITQMYRSIAGHKPLISQVGLKTFVDPRLDGSKATTITKEELIELVKIDDKEYLRYPDLKVDVALIRGSYADENGNLSIREEISTLELLEAASAAKNSGGIVIAQVAHLVENGSLDPKEVVVPGGIVDYIVVSPQGDHKQTQGVVYDPALSNQIQVVLDKDKEPLPLSPKKIIARRAAMELEANTVINVGVGTPDLVPVVAQEEGIGDLFTSTVENGVWGGSPVSGLDFGAVYNAEASISMANHFDLYDGGVLDLTVLGIGEVDQAGNDNVSMFGNQVAGPGGFINISQNTQNIVFVGTLTVGGKSHVENGKVIIDKQGKMPKFVKHVSQVTFSGEFATEKGQNILYVTERGVFDLHDNHLRLIEIAPGIDLQKDIIDQMEFEPEVSKNLVEMNPDIFQEKWGKLADIVNAKTK